MNRADDRNQRDDRNQPKFGHADRPPTEEEEQAADRARDSVDDDVADHFEEMLERGANQKGEGRIG